MSEYKTGVIAGNFDIIHPGYIEMFKECSENCENFIVLLHTDPSIERPIEKLKPILSVQDRMKILFSIRYITNIYTYTYENELVNLLEEINPDVRFLGDDYKNKTYTGFELNIPIHWINRSHGWSTTKFKKLISESIDKKENRPWGYYEVLSETNDSKVKRITVKPEQRLSLQYHEKRDELWHIISGKGIVTVGDGDFVLEAQDTFTIFKGQHHRIKNITDEDLVFIEIQTGEYFGEDDIIRLEDDYNRK